MTRKSILTAGLLAPLLLTGCTAASTAPTVSVACTAAIHDLTQVPVGDQAAEDAAITASATACSSWDEYLTAVEANPGSWFYTDASEVRTGAASIALAICSVDETTPVCRDAQAKGITD